MFTKIIKFAQKGLLTSIIILFSSSIVWSQRLDVHYVPTHNDVVEAMLKVADVKEGDYVIDLGSGDGRIVIAAVKRGAKGHGVDLDSERIKEANENAEKEGISDKVNFLQENIFETEISNATVITMYLLEIINRRMKPILFEKLAPGTRVVSHDFHMGDWKADIEFTVEYEDDGWINSSYVYFWIIPASIEGNWQWEINNEEFEMKVEQQYQQINVQLANNNNNLTVERASISGKNLTILASNPSEKINYEFKGEVTNNTITGEVEIKHKKTVKTEKWNTQLNKNE